ncbi:hypothetical protein GW916_00085 [bacterium]|nr:hypothetical protein [bacterium]
MRLKPIAYGALIFMMAASSFAYIHYLPRLEKYALKQLIQISNESDFIAFRANALTINPLLLRAELSAIEIQPKEKLKGQIGTISVRQAAARLSFLGLLRGQVRIAKLEAREVKAQLIVNLEKKSNEPLEIPLDAIFRSPIDAMDLEEVTLIGRVDPQKTVFKFDQVSLKVENRYRSLWLDLEAPYAFLKPSGPSAPVEFELNAKGLIEKDQIRLTALKVKKGDSYLISSGFFWGDVSKMKIESSEMASKLFLDLSSIKDWVGIFAPKKEIPKINGFINVSSTSGFKEKKPYLNLKVRGEKVQLDKYEIGEFKLDGTLTKSSIQSLVGEFKNSSGQAKLNQFTMNFDEPYALNFKAAPNVELGQFLKTIGIKKVPLKMKVSGETTCQGTLKPVQMACDQTEVLASEAHLQSGEKGQTILKFKKAKAIGQFEISDRDIRYRADLELGDSSKGSSSGTIDYKSGFLISYKADDFSFADLENLVNLKLEGQGSIEGQTQGDSDSATMSLKAKFKDFWLEDYGLGQISSEVLYDKGYLHFKETNGLYGNSRYSGHLSINLPESQIYLYMKSPYIEMPDVRLILERRLPIPFAITGTGNVEFKASGPLDITKMNYEVKADVYRGSIARESFDSITARLRAQEGILSTQDLRIKKGSGEVIFNGSIQPEWNIDLSAEGKGLRLEQAERFSELGLDIQGGYNFKTRIFGDIKKPTIDLSGSTQNMHAGDFPVEDSQFKLNIKEQSLSGSAQLLGDKIESQFTIPLQEDQEFSFKAKAKDLNVSSLFEAVSKARQTYDFETRTSFDVDLYAKTGGFWKSTGVLTISDFLIRRGGQSLNSDGPMKLLVSDGTVNSENFGLSGENSYLKLDIRSSTKERINGRLNGKVDLNILGPFMTFASEVRGTLSLNTSFLGSIEDLNVSGSAYLDQGYLKPSAFPHPLTDLRADMLFNQKSLFINSFQGKVADGSLNGSGKIQYESSISMPIEIDGQLKDVSINFPEGYRTAGQAQFSVTGKRFPYVFKMDYEVKSAEVVSEFGGASDGSGVRRSPYLPPALSKTSKEPFYLDLNLILLNPLKISNSMLKAVITGGLRIQGDTQALKMTGTLTPKPGGTVFFRDVPFEISSGFIEYDNVGPENPKLYLAATARVGEIAKDEDRRQTEKQYDISMLVQGRATDPQLSLSSQPPLPQKDIVSLLALGLTSEALDESRISGDQVTSTSTTALGAALLQKPVGKKLKDNFGVDMKVTSSQASPEVASAAKVTFSKQWTPKLSVSASGTIEASPRSSVKLEYEMNRGLSVIGSWEGREQGAALNNETKDSSNSVLGLDLEYRLQFK